MTFYTFAVAVAFVRLHARFPSPAVYAFLIYVPLIYHLSFYTVHYLRWISYTSCVHVATSHVPDFFVGTDFTLPSPRSTPFARFTTPPLHTTDRSPFTLHVHYRHLPPYLHAHPSGFRPHTGLLRRITSSVPQFPYTRIFSHHTRLPLPLRYVRSSRLICYTYVPAVLRHHTVTLQCGYVALFDFTFGRSRTFTAVYFAVLDVVRSGLALPSRLRFTTPRSHFGYPTRFYVHALW